MGPRANVTTRTDATSPRTRGDLYSRVPVLPIPTRVSGGRMEAPAPNEILTLAAALVAASGLTPAMFTAIGGASDGDRRVTVKVTAPEAT
ncbi:MAG TPA: hypothetical protein VJN18_05340 [Polyangiaceae bacterium]|nr:hypothetical protein [Polyangiaceae bacterium]